MQPQYQSHAFLSHPHSDLHQTKSKALIAMDRVDSDVDVPKLFDALLEILPRLMKSFMAQRCYVLGSLSAYLLVIQGDEDELSPEAMTELELICTVSATHRRRKRPKIRTNIQVVAKALHQHHTVPHTNTQSIGRAGKHRRFPGSFESGQCKLERFRFCYSETEGTLQAIREGEKRRRRLRSSTDVEDSAYEACFDA
jgi:hypothetical protein